MIKNKISLLLLIFLIPTVLASTTSDDIKNLQAQPFNRPINLILDCDNNGTDCSSSATCNITSLTYPNSSLVFSGKQMSRDFPPNFNISIPQLTTFGYYFITQRCYDGGLAGSQTYTFEVTADGNPSQRFPIQIIVMIMGFIAIVIGHNYREMTSLKYLGGIILMIMGVITLFPGYSYINSYNLIGLALGTVAIAIGFLGMIYDVFDQGVTRRDTD